MKLLESSRAVFFYRTGTQSDNIQHKVFVAHDNRATHNSPF